MTEFCPVSSLLNHRVLDGDGDLVGTVRELLMDPVEGRIVYVRLTLQCEDDTRSHSVVVPWSLMKVDPSRREECQIGVRGSTLRRMGQPDVGEAVEPLRGGEH